MAINNDVQPATPLLPNKRFFTVEEANKAIPYVSKIVSDIRDTYRLALDLQQRLEFPTPGDDQDKIQRDYENTVEDLNRYVDELQKTGAELKDYSLGLIDFPGIHDGREICICWRYGEDSIVAWHETNAGFSGRQDIANINEPNQ